MRAIVVTRLGGPEVLELEERPAPEPGEGQLLVDVTVAGVNYRDIYEREMPGYGPGDPPFVPGIEGAGCVAAVGPGVEGFAPGDRVVWKKVFGSYVEQLVVPLREAVPIPDGIDDETACAALLQGMTAHHLLYAAVDVQPGDWILNHAAAGGVGLFLTQIAKLKGARVIGTTSSEEKAQVAREAGADEFVGYDEVPERVLEITGDGVAAAYDGVGRATLHGSLASLRPRGTCALYGLASGQPEPLDLSRLGKSVSLMRPSLSWYETSREQLLARADDVLGWVAEGKLQVRIGGRYPLADAAQAQRDLESRGTTGKLLLTIP
jgi:NADPH:quinone reductase